MSKLKKNSIHVASIDIGSNAVRLLILHGLADTGMSSLSKEAFVRMPVRLGKDAFQSSMISDDSCQKLCTTMCGFATLLKVLQPQSIAAVATAALREACNKEAVIQKVWEQSGLRIRCIDGIQEAGYLSINRSGNKAGNKAGMTNSAPECHIDIGGGSTEFNVTINRKTVLSDSFKVGTLRNFQAPKTQASIVAMKQWLTDQILPLNATFFASGGNVNKLSSLLSGNQQLNRTELFGFVNEFSTKTPQELCHIFNLKPDRADVIMPAAQIVQLIFQQLNIRTVTVPSLGLVEAVARTLFMEYAQQYAAS